MKYKKKSGAKLDKVNALLTKNRLTEAGNLCNQICKENNKNIDAWFLLGTIYARLGNYVEAELCFSRVINLKPDLFEAHNYKGLALVFAGKPQEAIASFQRSVQLKPDFARGYSNLGCLLRDLGRYEESADSFQKALQIDPNYIDAIVHLGNLLMFISDLDEAHECYQRALKIDPQNAGAITGEASILEKQGKYEGAYERIRLLINQGIITPSIAGVLGSLSSKLDCGDEAISLMEQLIAGQSLPPVEREELHFSLGKLYDREKNYDKAFMHYHSANTERPHPFNIAQYEDRIENIIQVFNVETVSALPNASGSDIRPIFIVGMPRSGTTLVEQILASHSEVTGGGELEYMDNIITDMQKNLGSDSPYSESIAGINNEQIEFLAKQYSMQLATIADSNKWVTDKMPPNFLHLGLISRLFPYSPIIHCIRDPIDTCLSCYFQNFGARHSYAFDLTNLAKVYCAYEKIMHYWKDIINIRILDLQYEELVSNTEKVTRNMLGFCGLEWDEQCLLYYKNERFAGTASYDQVRKPIYKSSTGRWKNYEKYLTPLKKTLEEASYLTK